MTHFSNGFIDELLKLAAEPAPYKTPATGAGLPAKATGAPSNAIGPSGAYLDVVKAQAMTSPAKPKQEEWTPTAGPKFTAPAAPVATPGKKGGGGKGDDWLPFEGGFSHAIRTGREASYNKQFAAKGPVTGAGAPSVPGVQPGAPKITGSQTTAVTPKPIKPPEPS